MEIHHFVDISATPDTVWSVLTDVTGWSRWMPGIVAAEMVDRSMGDEYEDAYVVARVNSTPSVWFVRPGADRVSLAWENSCADCTSHGSYRIEPLDEHLTRVHMTVFFEGASCPVAGVLGRYSLRDGVVDQAAALRSRCQIGVPVQNGLPAHLEPVAASRTVLPDRPSETRSSTWARRQAHQLATARQPS